MVDPLPDDAPFSSRTTTTTTRPRAATIRARSTPPTAGTSRPPLSLLNAKLLAYADEIRSAVLMIHGDKAHSCYFSRDAFARLQGDNKELLLIPAPYTPISTTEWTSSRSTASKYSIISI